MVYSLSLPFHYHSISFFLPITHLSLSYPHTAPSESHLPLSTSLCSPIGSHPSEERGTRSVFGIPKSPKTSPAAIAVWKVELHKSSQPQTGRVTLAVTPPPDAPTGQYSLSVRTSQKKGNPTEYLPIHRILCH